MVEIPCPSKVTLDTEPPNNPDILTTMSDVTRLLSEIESGNPKASEDLLPLVYDELRKLAASRLAKESPGQTIQATALVHDAYVRLVDGCAEQAWDSRGHFFSAAAESIRRILIDRARHKQSLKRGGSRIQVELSSIEPIVMPIACDDVLALDEALEKLRQKDARKAELVKLRFFAGLTTIEAANALGISSSTADNDWAYARAWLKMELLKESGF